MSWWRSGVLYQIYPRSFADSNGDGVGDLRGIINRLDHLEWLGIDGIWLSPITVSANADWGYDVVDYSDVQPEYGTLADADELVNEAGRRGIRVLLDLVPNHTSDQHPWFTEQHPDWYVWADTPNNWVSMFGGSAWSLDRASGRYYLHNFTPEQPDLDWWNEEVRAAFDDILRFWLNRGIAGFRIDVCHAIIKDASLRNNPPAEEGDHFMTRHLGQRSVYNANRNEVHDILRRWRALADQYDPPRVLFGETFVHDTPTMARFYGNGDDELHLALNVPFQESPFTAGSLRDVVEATEAALPPNAWPLWSGSSHDVSRMARRWAGGDPMKARLAVLMLLTLRGTPLLYYGDELGLPDTIVSKEDLRDPVGVSLWPAHPGRDPARTPMPWNDEPGAGFTEAGVRPWLPFGDLGAHNVKAQRDDPSSILNFTRDVIALRRDSPDLLSGDRVPITAAEGLWVWRRGDATLIALNFADTSASLAGVVGRTEIATDRSRDGEAVDGRLELGPWEAVVVDEALDWEQRVRDSGTHD